MIIDHFSIWLRSDGEAHCPSREFVTKTKFSPNSQHAILIGFWFKISLEAPKAQYFGPAKENIWSTHLIVDLAC